MTSNTSRWSYEEIKKSGYLGKHQAMYLAIFTDPFYGAMTHKQATMVVNKFFNVRMPERNGRISELSDMGYLKVVDTKECEFTHKIVQVWKWTGRKIPKVKVLRLYRCEHCDGRGSYMKEVWEEQAAQKDLFKNEKKERPFDGPNHYA